MFQMCNLAEFKTCSVFSLIVGQLIVFENKIQQSSWNRDTLHRKDDGRWLHENARRLLESDCQDRFVDNSEIDIWPVYKRQTR